MPKSTYRAATDSRALNAATLINMAVECTSPLQRVQLLAEAQRQTAFALSSGLNECEEAKVAWTALAEATGTGREALFRQHKAGAPIVVVKTTHTPNQGAEMIDTVYSFEAEADGWFGPADVLEPGKYRNGMLSFNPNPLAGKNKFAGQYLRVRIGPRPAAEVSAHAAQIRFPDGTEERVRVTDEILDLLFDQSNQTLLRRAVMAAHYATGPLSGVDPAVTAALLQAADALNPAVPEAVFLACVRDALRIAESMPSTNPTVRTAVNRLSRAVREYDALTEPGAN